MLVIVKLTLTEFSNLIIDTSKMYYILFCHNKFVTKWIGLHNFLLIKQTKFVVGLTNLSLTGNWNFRSNARTQVEIADGTKNKALVERWVTVKSKTKHWESTYLKQIFKIYNCFWKTTTGKASVKCDLPTLANSTLPVLLLLNLRPYVKIYYWQSIL